MVYRIFLRAPFTQGFYHRIVLSYAAAATATIIFALFVGSSSESVLNQGDFSCFYAAGKIIRDGLGSKLYDAALQNEYQKAIFPTAPGFFYFAYPAWFAALFVPLTLLPFVAAKWVYTAVLCLLAALAAVAMTQRTKGQWLSVVPVLFFPAVLFANLAGQNTALSLFLLTYLHRELALDKPREMRAAFYLAALLFKPHFALLAGLFSLIFWRGDSRFKLIYFSTAFSLFLVIVSIPLCGISWPVSFLRGLQQFAAENWSANGANMISLPAQFGGWSYAVSLMLFSFTCLLLRKIERPEPFLSLITLVLSPHALFYDLGVVIPSFLLLPIQSRGLVYFVASVLFILPIPDAPERNFSLLTAFLTGIFLYAIFRQRWKKTADKVSAKKNLL